MDLTKEVPRSAFVTLGGIVFLPRAIDKARADLAGTRGEYRSRTGRSAWMCDFLGITSEDFHEAVRTRATDAEVWEWVSANMVARTPREIVEHNDWMCNRTPDNDIWTWEDFWKFMNDIGCGDRTDISRHFDRLDLDEGREVPFGGSWWR